MNALRVRRRSLPLTRTSALPTNTSAAPQAVVDVIGAPVLAIVLVELDAPAADLVVLPAEPLAASVAGLLVGDAGLEDVPLPGPANVIVTFARWASAEGVGSLATIVQGFW